MTLFALFVTMIIGYICGMFAGYQVGQADGERGTTFLGRKRTRTFLVPSHRVIYSNERSRILEEATENADPNY